MIAEGILCTGCSLPLPRFASESENGALCPGCGARVQVKAFRALLARRGAAVPQSLKELSEASCFYHAQNQAAAPCDDCGRFLCNLCALEIPGKTLCPVCFENNVSGRKLETLETSRTMHDSIALAFATLPVMLFWPVIVTAPMAIFWSIRHWNSPRSIIPRSRIRFYLAILFAVLEIVLIGVLIVAIFVAARKGRR